MQAFTERKKCETEFELSGRIEAYKISSFEMSRRFASLKLHHRHSPPGISSECGTWSHAVMSSLGARARGGVGRAPAFSVARCQTWTQVSHPRCPSTEDFGNRTVTFRIDHTPLDRIAVQFEWAEPFCELQKNQKMGHFGGMSVFAEKKMCAFQRSSGLVVIRRVARLSRIGARLMF